METTHYYKSAVELGGSFEIREPKPSSMLRQAITEAEQIRREYTDGMRKPVPFTNAHDMIQEILSEEDDG